MKKLCIISIIIIIFTISFVSADVIPQNSHALDKCVKFVNLEDFPEIILVGFYTGPMVDTYEAYPIIDNECLTKGYKFNSLSIYWTTKENFEKIDLKDLKLSTQKIPTGGTDDNGNTIYMDLYSPRELNLLIKNINPYGGYIDEDNPLKKEIIEYSIAENANDPIFYYKSKQTSEFNNGDANKIEVFEKPNEKLKINNTMPKPAPGPSPNPPTPKPQGIWEKMIYFFKTLFGRNN